MPRVRQQNFVHLGEKPQEWPIVKRNHEMSRGCTLEPLMWHRLIRLHTRRASKIVSRGETAVACVVGGAWGLPSLA